MRNVALLTTRLVIGGYLAVHGAQKLFGAFGGGGLDRTAAASTGSAWAGPPDGRGRRDQRARRRPADRGGDRRPAGPLAIMGTMAVAATTHRAKGPLSAPGGFELPLTNLAAAAALAAAGPGRFRLGPALPRPLAAGATAGGALLAAGLVARMLTAKPPAPEAPAPESSTPGDPAPPRRTRAARPDPPPSPARNRPRRDRGNLNTGLDPAGVPGRASSAGRAL